MALQHVRLDHANPIALLSGSSMPRLEFRQALFRTPEAGWHRRLYPAALVITTTALDVRDRKLVVDHQTLRFSLLYDATWPEPVFLKIQRWPYRPVELRRDAPVAYWTVELRLRDLRLGPEEWVEFVFVG
jgi:hypothetical protein